MDPPAPITAADESFTHQEVAPAARTAHVHPRWAERCWHLVDVGDGWVLGTGRALWPHAGERTAVAGVAADEVVWAVRAREPVARHDDPDHPVVGPIRIEAVVPLQEVRLVCEPVDPDGLAYDLTWRARVPPVPTARNRIERHGEVRTDYMNAYQSGLVSGTVRAGGEERVLEDRAAFRDRGWGLRAHEGAARRGMHVFVGCELADRAMYLLLYETAAGERVFTNGWVLDADGLADTVVEAAHDLQLHGRRLRSGTVDLQLASGRGVTIAFVAHARLAMEAVGYTAVAGRAAPGVDRIDLRDPALAASWDGLYDNACRFDVDGEVGHGYVEVGLGVHARYLPEVP